MVTTQLAGRVGITGAVACEVLSRKSPTRPHAEAQETLRKAEGMFQKMGMDYWLRRTQEVLARVQQ